MSIVLECQDVDVTYGRTKAVNELSFTLQAGEVLGVIGPNGAGKTTLVDALTGFLPIARGSIRLRNQDLAGARPHVRARLGLGRTWQSIELYEDLTVRENVQVAADSPRAWSMLTDIVRPGRRVSRWAMADRLLHELGIRQLGDHMVSEIPQDKRKLVGIARALASDPDVVLLDEPAAGLNTSESSELGQELRRVARDGVAVLLIEHDMELVLSVCDRIIVLDFGRKIAEGNADEIVKNPDVIAAYLGGGDVEAIAAPEEV